MIERLYEDIQIKDGIIKRLTGQDIEAHEGIERSVRLHSSGNIRIG